MPPPEKHGLVVLPPPAAEPAAAADAPGGAPAAPKDAPDSADDGLAFILGKPQPESASLNLVEAAELASVAAEPGGGDAAPPLSGAPEPDPAASAAGDPLAAAEPPQPDAAAAPGGERSVTAEEGLEPPLRGEAAGACHAVTWLKSRFLFLSSSSELGLRCLYKLVNCQSWQQQNLQCDDHCRCRQRHAGGGRAACRGRQCR